MNTHPNLPTEPRQDAPDDDGNADDDSNEVNPALQGEGNYTAARRHRESAEQFVGSGEVDRAARDAEPENEQEAAELRDAEAQGREHAKK